MTILQTAKDQEDGTEGRVKTELRLRRGRKGVLTYKCFDFG